MRLSGSAGARCGLATALAALAFSIQAAPGGPSCSNAVSGEKQLLWGDLHVHTAWSLDAYAYGAAATPADAFAFARGQPLRLGNGEQVAIDRPLDFAAVTDHADTFDVMYLCTDPLYRGGAYCTAIRDGRRARQGRNVFIDYLLPIVAHEPPEVPSLCAAEDADCAGARAGQWRRIQETANEHDDPCAFTAFIGYEWSASPGGRHWHRNVIFRSDQVPDQAFDYLRFPRVHQLWEALDATCRPEDGCDVLAIPHNINWADGGSFDVSAEASATLTLRTRYERLAEIHQEKGASECLSERRDDGGADCAFERLIGNFAQSQVSGGPAGDADEAWQRMRSTYYRSLLTRGLVAFDASGRAGNPLMLGAVGSTDTHMGTAGDVAEAGFGGGMSMLWQDDEARLANTGYNPGGLVAVWAEENTRASVFDALQRREAYATSGPRISLRFGTAAASTCEAGTLDLGAPMGSTIHRAEAPRFAVLAGRDRADLAAVQIVKGEVRDGAAHERVFDLAVSEGGSSSFCLTWQDPDFEPAAPAYWYARVLEVPTPRWSRILCERLDKCDAYPDADRMIQERAWSSPIWYEPEAQP